MPSSSVPSRLLLDADEMVAAADHAKVIHAARWREERSLIKPSAHRSGRARSFRAVRRLLAATEDLHDLDRATGPDLRRVLRFLPALPVSEHDLRAQLHELTKPGQALHDVPATRQPAAFIRLLLQTEPDARLRGERALKPRDRHEIVRVIGRAMHAQEMATLLRNRLAHLQEQELRDRIAKVGFAMRATGTMTSASDLPAGFFTTREVRIRTAAGTSKADCVVRPAAHVIVPIECKVSGSDLNGHKRLVKEVGDKASEWRSALRDVEVVPVAVIGGYFKPADALTAQAKGVAVVWDHDLDRLTAYLRACRSAPE